MIPSATRPRGFSLREGVLYRILPSLLPDSVKCEARVAVSSQDLRGWDWECRKQAGSVK